MIVWNGVVSQASFEEGGVWRRAFWSLGVTRNYLHNLNSGGGVLYKTFHFTVRTFSHGFTGGRPRLSTPPVVHASLGFRASLPAPDGLCSSLLCRLFHMGPVEDSICLTQTYRCGGNVTFESIFSWKNWNWIITFPGIALTVASCFDDSRGSSSLFSRIKQGHK